MPDGDIDVFISYKKEEREYAEKVAQALEQAGYVAVADFTSIELNEDFAEKIDHLIRSARLVLVLWTKASANSRWVRAEATLAVDLGTYLGVLVESADLRVDLRPIQKIDVSANGLDAELPRLMAEVRGLLGAGVVSPAEAERLSADRCDELVFYRRIEEVGTYEAFALHLAGFPNGQFAELAAERLTVLAH